MTIPPISQRRVGGDAGSKIRRSFAQMREYLTAERVAKNYFPERLEIVEEFPRIASGKIQKFKLRELARTLAEM